MKTIFMPKRLWKKWDKALRSGEYNQAEGVLYDPESCGFCCLGVLQHVADRGKVQVFENQEEEEFMKLPTQDWLKYFGIKFKNEDRNVVVTPFLPSFKCSADEANDCYNKTLPEIADAIAECVQFTDAKK